MHTVAGRDSRQKQLDNQPDWDAARTILLMGGMLFAVLSMPAICQRGYPPIDPAWEAIPFLWILPIVLSAIFNHAPDRTRLRSVAIYAVVTAFFVSGTFTFMVPRSVNPVGMLFMTLFGTGPAHVLIASVIEFIAQCVHRFCHYQLATVPVIRSGLKWSIAATIVTTTLIAPFLWRHAVYVATYNSARQQAEQDWNDRRALVYRSMNDATTYFNDERIKSDFDFATGFKLETFPQYFGYAEAYNQRIDELVAERGIPQWSLKKHIVSHEDLLAMLHSDRMQSITKFPHPLSTDVVLQLTNRLGKPKPGTTDFGDSLRVQINHGPGVIQYQPSQLSIGLQDDKPIYLGRHPSYPQVIFVRTRQNSIYAFHETGLLLSSIR